jgi:hypothetical protein
MVDRHRRGRRLDDHLDHGHGRRLDELLVDGHGRERRLDEHLDLGHGRRLDQLEHHPNVRLVWGSLHRLHGRRVS